MSIELVSRYRHFEGWVEFYKHASTATRTEMKFSVYRPPQAESRKVPVLYWLSGLTCTEENFMVKSGAQRYAAEHGLMIVAPDTSPRGAGIPGEGDAWDFGLGAGFYVNATLPRWSDHYRELPGIVEGQFPVKADRAGISGHSMGGHGAMVLSLRHPGRYQSVSAFSPICAPSLCPWGQKAFTGYLGADRSAWAEYDANVLVTRARTRLPIRIDQGGEDKFLNDQLMPEIFQATCAKADYPIDLKIRAGYDHSYYFVASFIGEHIAYHASFLNRS